MKFIGLIGVMAMLLLAGCKSGSEQDSAENDLDAARGFVQAALKGKYDRAADFMLHDSLNDERLDAVSRMELSSDEKQGLWDASINIHSRKLVNDSTSIIIYSNSFHKENQDTLKVVKKEGKWLVDFKYLFDHE
ncbi:hypothetical protein [Niabella hibiscisoli]|uniref:hypothetical protein n=1 Tax=Niabella hibiscisoli TaxID=1825928 RepID=UPI001F0FD74D|nr:hypothetical protein [Niabella hibiscisoli]MCH5714976.1 hypothetical protein [Niabella hibiscisoli]